jgi:predicted dehydrogenase
MDDGASEFFLSNCLIVGSGSIAEKHIKACQMCLANVRIYQVPSRENTSLNEISGVNRAETIDSVLVNIKLDFVIICSPASHHAHHIKLILDKNRIPILVEKPLSDSREKLVNIVDADKDLIRVAYCLRHLPVVSAFRGYLKKNLGDTGIKKMDVICLSNVKKWRNKFFLNTVSASRELGGGVLRELSHEIDLITWLFNVPEVIETHDIKYSILEMDVETAARFSFYYRNGLTVEFNLDFGSVREVRELRVETHDASRILLDVNKRQLKIEGETCPVVDKDMYATQLELFVGMTKGHDGEALCSFRQAEVVLSLIEKVEKSYRERRSIYYVDR